MPVTPSQAKQMVEHLVNLADVFAGTRWAVVTSQPASYGMMRMVSVHAERVPMDVRIFSSLEAAESLAGLCRRGLGLVLEEFTLRGIRNCCLRDYRRQRMTGDVHF